MAHRTRSSAGGEAAGPFSTRRLARDLAQLGVLPGDTVMVHASLRAIGPTEAGAAGVVEALDRAVGSAGTLLMLLGAEDRWAWVNELPEDDRAARLANTAPFDALLTPANPEVGVLAEVFRQSQGTAVSDHPEGRFAARGSAAETILADPPWHDYYGPGSPLEKLVEHEGKVLRLGANPETVSLFHYAEYLAELPAKRRVCRHRLVSGAHGPTVRVIECLDDEEGIVDYPGDDYFAVILRLYLAEDRARTGTVGRAASELIDAGDVLRFAVEWMNAHLDIG